MVLAAFFLSTCELGTSTLEVIVNAASPVITFQPEVKQYNPGDTITMSVTAMSPDGGAITYQWYSFNNGREYYSQTGTAVPGAVGRVFNPVASGFDQEDTVYKFYVIVTNNKPDLTGRKSVSVQSGQGSFVIANPDNAPFPLITRHPASATYILRRGMSITMSMSAELSANVRGDLTYQWYQVDEYSNEKGTPIEGATANAFVPPIGSGLMIDGVGSYYFFVVLTSTDLMATGKKQTTAVTDVAEIIVQLDPDAEVPEIITNPKSKIYFIDDDDDPIVELEVEAYNVGDGGTLSYQWYRNTTNANTGGTAIAGASGTWTADDDEEIGETVITTLMPPVSNASASRSYYYVVITNTNPAAVRTKRSTATSNVAAITVQSLRDMEYLLDYFSNVHVNLDDPKQYVRGFGGMDVAWGNFPTYTMADYEKMYNPRELGYNMVRVMIMPTYTDINKTMEELVANKLTGSQDRSNFYEFAKLVNRYGGYVLASPWSPPAAWKTNNSVNGGGDLRPSNYKDMARYLDAFARNMYNNGAPIYAITLQNEPSYTAGYDGCEYTSDTNQELDRKSVV
jgi:hypothetical protein